jgi:hypothetical protein
MMAVNATNMRLAQLWKLLQLLHPYQNDHFSLTFWFFTVWVPCHTDQMQNSYNFRTYHRNIKDTYTSCCCICCTLPLQPQTMLFFKEQNTVKYMRPQMNLKDPCWFYYCIFYIAWIVTNIIKRILKLWQDVQPVQLKLQFIDSIICIVMQNSHRRHNLGHFYHIILNIFYKQF